MDKTPPTRSEIERGLAHKNWRVRWQWEVRDDFVPTAEQFERGLTHKEADTRLRWARRQDFLPTPAQVDRGLKDKVRDIRQAWTLREDFTPTPQQIEAGLTDKDDEVRYAWSSRSDANISLEMLNRMIKYLAKKNFQPLDPVLEKQLRVRAEVAQLGKMVEGHVLKENQTLSPRSAL